jgi:hypothetical protein
MPYQGLLLLSSDSNNDRDDCSMTHIAFSSFSISFVCYAHAPLLWPLPSWLSPSLRSSSLVPTALSNPLLLAIRCPRRSAAVGNLLPLGIRRRADTSSPHLFSPCTHQGNPSRTAQLTQGDGSPTMADLHWWRRSGCLLPSLVLRTLFPPPPIEVPPPAMTATKTAAAAAHPFGPPDRHQIRHQCQSQRQRGSNRHRPALQLGSGVRT